MIDNTYILDIIDLDDVKIPSIVKNKLRNLNVVQNHNSTLQDLTSVFTYATKSIMKRYLDYKYGDELFIYSLKNGNMKTTQMEEMIHKVTCSLILNMSIHQLGILISFIDRKFIYSYLKMEIIDTIDKEIELFIKLLNNDNDTYKIEEDHNNIKRLVASAITSLMILHDSTKFITIMKELLEKYNEKYNTIILEYFKNNNYFFPSKLLSPFINNDGNTFVDVYSKFIEELNSTFTEEGFKKLCLQYNENDINSLTKIILTYNDMIDHNSIRDLRKIDGLKSVEELRVLNKIILDLKLNTIETDMMENSTLLLNIYKIIKKFRKFTNTIDIDNELITMSSNHSKNSYRYRLDDIDNIVNDKFLIFDHHSENVKTILEKEPKKSFMNQLVISKDLYSKLLSNNRLPKTTEETINTRYEVYNKLLNEHRTNKDLMLELNKINTTTPPAITYSDPLNFSTIVLDDPETTLKYIAELNRIRDYILFNK